MLVTGRTATGSRFRSGCVAHATSRDGLRWQLQKPLYAPAQFEDLEVVSYLRHSDRHALFFHQFQTGNTLCRVADALTGPWRPPPRELLLPQWNAVFRFCERKGRRSSTTGCTQGRLARRASEGRGLMYAGAAQRRSSGMRRESDAPFVRGVGPAIIAEETTLSIRSFKPIEATRKPGAERWGGWVAVDRLGAFERVRPLHRRGRDHAGIGAGAGLVFRGDAKFEIANWLGWILTAR